MQPTSVKLLFFFLLTCTTVFSQDRCGTAEYMRLKADQKLILENKDVFERWVRERSTRMRKRNPAQRTMATYQVPVVVHIIHNGQNHETNIPDEQVISQIRVLNEDFNRTNPDAGQTPADFIGVAGSMDIEFVLAKQDPQGLPTTGIVRVQGTQNTWTINDNYKLKALSYWPSEDYLNIWVCRLTGYIGYAQFPQTDLLSGLENASTNRLTDGVVITYNAFGSDDDGDFNLQSRYNKGRTTTHEVGHFFGLRHIWGDENGCGTAGDYVDDTPDQDSQTTGCPAHPKSACSNAVMFQNFLDYTNDACMNIFTAGQVERMTTVIENSPRRLSLLTSHGSSEPAPIADNLGIAKINAPLYGTCSATVIPEIEVVNFGTNEVTSAAVILYVNNTPVETKTFSLSLDPLESATLTFAETTFAGASASFRFEINEVNSVADQDELNNTKIQNVVHPATIAIPFHEDFSSFPSGWTIQNPDQIYTWQVADAPDETTSNEAMKMDFYNYEDNFGEIDLLITPAFDLTSAPSGTVLFDISYAQYQGSNDGLQIFALDNCNTDITKGTLLYSKAGSALKTHDATSEPYQPSEESDWRTESVDLTAFLGQPHVQLAFVGVNDYGNNLYLDNVRVVTDLVNNLTLQDVLSPGPVTCVSQLSPAIAVRNSGSPVSSFTVNYTVNGLAASHQFTNTNLAFGDVKTFILPDISLDAGMNDLSFTILDPNGEVDVNVDDNTLTWQTHVSEKKASIPFAENFQGAFASRWVMVNPAGDRDWKPATIERNTAVFFEGYDYDVTDSRAWLVTPTLDLSDVDSLGLAFDVSYVTRDGGSDALMIFTSSDCGESFNLYQTFTGVELSVGDEDEPWEPASDADWVTKELSLKHLAHQRDARVAFVFQNAGINNLYLDNVSILAGSSVEIKRGFQLFPNPLIDNDRISIMFNLPRSADVVIEVFDRMGRRVFTANMAGILDQTEVLNIGPLGSGMYTMRVTTPGHVYVRKFISTR